MLRFIFYLGIITVKYAHCYNEPLRDEYSYDLYSTKTSLPIDANENSLPPNHWTQTVPGKIIFNFEQDRKDQPPLIHVRQEPVGKYWGRHSTTTTIAPFILPQFDQHHSGHVKAPIYLKDRFYDGVPPPPTFPNWESVAQNLDSYPAQNQEPTFEQPAISSQSVAEPNIDPATTAMFPGFRFHSTNAVPGDEVKSYSQIEDFVPSTSEKQTEVILRKKNNNRHTSNRGSRKYSKGDIQNYDTYKQTTTEITQTPSSARVPPPVPTLSPWYDGFGK